MFKWGLRLRIKLIQKIKKLFSKDYYNIIWQDRKKHKNPQDLGVYLKDDNDELLAGLIGNTHGNWLTVKYLWVSEALRGQSIGSDILRKAEEEARGRGCKYVFLDTFSFQLKSFIKSMDIKKSLF